LRKLRMVHMGLGDFGSNWFENVLPYSILTETVGVVTTNAGKLDWIRQVSGLREEQVFQDEESALKALCPDFILCVTPPHAHKQNILTALKLGIPVVCEKPIAETQADALEILNASVESGIPVVIAENYRYMDIMIRAREICQVGVLGRLRYVCVDFYRHHSMNSRNYHNSLTHPLLLDVGIHHLDLLRYVTGLEPVSVGASAWDYEETPYFGNSCVTAHVEMENSVHAAYFGSLSSYMRPNSSWRGDWRIDGENGQMRISGDDLIVSSDVGDFQEHIEDNNSLLRMIDSIAENLQKNVVCDNDIRNNIRTFYFTVKTMLAADTGIVQAI
jgi:predicted dehydrogenase